MELFLFKPLDTKYVDLSVYDEFLTENSDHSQRHNNET